MLRGKAFQHIDGGGDLLAFSVLHRDGKVQLVEENVAQLLRRIDVELDTGFFVNVASLRGTFALKTATHVVQHVAVNLHARFFHAGEDRNERKINFLVNLEES